jgi:Domain of unknown function (DUF4214)
VNGSDSNDGTTLQRAWETLQRAHNSVPDGATVLVADGIYTSDSSVKSVVLRITKSGTPSSWLTFAALPGHRPIVQVPKGAWSGIEIATSHHVLIDGIEVVGRAQSMTMADVPTIAPPTPTEGCVAIGGGGLPQPYAVIFRNSVLHDCPGGGIMHFAADSAYVLENHIYNNGWYTWNGIGGINLIHQADSGQADDIGGYRTYVVGNLVERNWNYVGWVGTPGKICDGDGIIVDANKHTQPGNGPGDVQGVPYTGRTYIANNIVRDSGAQGINAYISARVDIVNNTVYNSLLTETCNIRGEITVFDSTDVNVTNDVAINLNGKRAVNSNSGFFDYNVWSGGSPNPTQLGAHGIAGDPHLSAPAQGDFAPAANSPALRSGTDFLAPAVDFFGNPRPLGRIDRGAIQVSVGSAYSMNYVEEAYVAYYGRPADPAGQTYWALRMDAEGQSLNAIIGAFGNSDEFNHRYGGLTNTQLVTKIYQQALNRDPDPAGLAYYVGELQADRRTLQSITLDVLNGATTAPDSMVVGNKLDVAAYYTAKVAAGCAYGTEQDGVNSLSGVTAVSATVTAAKTAIDTRCAP